MSDNFCKMTAVVRNGQIKSFKISDPYVLCTFFPAWKTAPAYYNDTTGELTAFGGPNGVRYELYDGDELYQEVDHDHLDWFLQIEKQDSWYVVPTEHDLIDIANDSTLFSELWYFTKFDNDGTFFLLDMD